MIQENLQNKLINEYGIKTICVDEAHHLQNEYPEPGPRSGPQFLHVWP